MGNSPSTSRREGTSSSHPTPGVDVPPPPYSHSRSASFSGSLSKGDDKTGDYGADVKLSPTPESGSSPISPPSGGRRSFAPWSKDRVKQQPTQSADPEVEDALVTLARYDTVIIMDDSTSMTRGPPGSTYWDEAREALASLAGVAAKYDANGIDLVFLNSETKGKNIKDSSQVQRLFDKVRPRGATPIGERLEELLHEYIVKLEKGKSFKGTKPVNYIVITDGEPTDDPQSVIVKTAKRLDAQHAPLTQVGIQFLQIGNDGEATKYLEELDRELSHTHGIRDMVDTTPYTGERLTSDGIIKVLLGGINRRLDGDHEIKR